MILRLTSIIFLINFEFVNEGPTKCVWSPLSSFMRLARLAEVSRTVTHRLRVWQEKPVSDRSDHRDLPRSAVDKAKQFQFFLICFHAEMLLTEISSFRAGIVFSRDGTLSLTNMAWIYKLYQHFKLIFFWRIYSRWPLKSNHWSRTWRLQN